MDASFTADSDQRFTLNGPIQDEGERGLMVGGHDLLEVFRERRGIAAAETPGGGERVPGSAEVRVTFKP